MFKTYSCEIGHNVFPAVCQSPQMAYLKYFLTAVKLVFNLQIL